MGLAKQRLLRAGIVLYGLRLTFQDIGHVGVAGVLPPGEGVHVTGEFATVDAGPAALTAAGQDR